MSQKTSVLAGARSAARLLSRSNVRVAAIAACLAGCIVAPLVGSPTAQGEVSKAKEPLRLGQFLAAVHQNGRLALPTTPSIAWAGADQIVFTSPRSQEPRQIYLAKLDGAVHAIANGYGPKLSGDGRWMVYLDPTGKLTVATLRNGTVRTIATLKRRESEEGILPNIGSTYGWQSGGHQMFYLKYRGQRPFDGSLNWIEPTQPEVHVFDPTTGADRVVYAVNPPPPDDPSTSAPTGIGNLVMAKDGTIYLVEGSGNSRTGTSAYLKAVKDGKARILARVGNSPLLLVPSLSPDQRTIAMSVSRDPDYLTYVGTEYRGIIDVATGKTRILPGPYPFGMTMVWSPDSRRVFYVCKTGALANRLCVGGRSRTLDSVMAPLEGLSDIEQFAISPDGRRTAWISRDVNDNVMLKVSEPNGGIAKTLWSNALLPMDNVALGETRTFHWQSSDGLRFEGLLTLPPGYKGGRLPLLVDIHGGPNGGVHMDGSLLGGASPIEAQLWAGMGYAYFRADYREAAVVNRSPNMLRMKPGTTIYETNARDVLAGVDALIADGIADPKRIVGLGHSMGAVTMATLLTITDRFAVAVDKEGLEDWSILPGVRNPDDNPADLKTRMWAWRAGSAEDVKRIAATGSAITHADAIKTPVLVIKSSPSAERNDVGRRFVDAVNKSGGEASLLTFADDYHVTVREANSQRIAHEVINWINGHLGIPTPAD